MKVSRKARRGRKRRPKPHGDHHNVGATQDPLVRARRAAPADADRGLSLYAPLEE
ncbi:MAG: hypothetical protein WA862_01675 [Solirubrobacterales bacterium]